MIYLNKKQLSTFFHRYQDVKKIFHNEITMKECFYYIF